MLKQKKMWTEDNLYIFWQTTADKLTWMKEDTDKGGRKY